MAGQVTPSISLTLSFMNFLDLRSLVNTVLKILFITNNSLITIMLLKSAGLSKSIYHKTYL